MESWLTKFTWTRAGCEERERSEVDEENNDLYRTKEEQVLLMHLIKVRDPHITKVGNMAETVFQIQSSPNLPMIRFQKVVYFDKTHSYALQDAVLLPDGVTVQILRYPIKKDHSMSKLWRRLDRIVNPKIKEFEFETLPTVEDVTLFRRILTEYLTYDIPNLGHTPSSYRARHSMLMMRCPPGGRDPADFVERKTDKLLRHISAPVLLQLEQVMLHVGPPLVVDDRIRNVFRILYDGNTEMLPVEFTSTPLEELILEDRALDMKPYFPLFDKEKAQYDGTSMHLYAERKLKGMPHFDIELDSEEDYANMDAFLKEFKRWLKQVGATIESEQCLGSYKHKLCGQADLIIRFANGLEVVLDIKRSLETWKEIKRMSGPAKTAAKLNLVEFGRLLGPLKSMELPKENICRVESLTPSGKCFDYGIQMGGYRRLRRLNGAPVSSYTYLVLAHPMIDQKFVLVEIDLAIATKGRAEEETYSLMERVDMCFEFLRQQTMM